MIALWFLWAAIPAWAPTSTKTWAFATDSEGLADAGNNANFTFAAQAGDGNPADSVKFSTTTKGQTMTEFARRASTGETWETWGIPAGNTVTQVQITAWDERLAANTKLSSHSIKARIIGSGGGTCHSAGDLLDVALGTTTDATWQAGAAGTAWAVDSACQASTTDVRLELEYTVTTSGGGGAANVDQRFDQIVLTITHSAPPAGKTHIIVISSLACHSACPERGVRPRRTSLGLEAESKGDSSQPLARMGFIAALGTTATLLVAKWNEGINGLQFFRLPAVLPRRLRRNPEVLLWKEFVIPSPCMPWRRGISNCANLIRLRFFGLVGSE